ncbi:hypothetical protein CY35_06G018100 [Sphagnum magellanicum]|nr:hypothetical protein CY35_06G018100 [Sphagnum magellanicum]
MLLQLPSISLCITQNVMSFFKHENFKPAPSDRRCFLLFIWKTFQIVSFFLYTLLCVCQLSFYFPLPTSIMYLSDLILQNPWVFFLSYFLLIQGFLYKTSWLDTLLGCAICTCLSLWFHYLSGTFALLGSVIPWVVFLLNNDIQVCKFFMALSIILSYFPFLLVSVDGVFADTITSPSISFTAYITGLLVLAVVFKVRSCYLKNIMYSVCLTLIWWLGIPVENGEILGLVVLELATFKHIVGFIVYGSLHEFIFIVKCFVSTIPYVGRGVSFCEPYTKNLSLPDFVFSENGPGKVEFLTYSSKSVAIGYNAPGTYSQFVEVGYTHQASGISFTAEMDNKYVIEREADEGDGVDSVVVAIECAAKIQYALKNEINFVEHVYGPISGIDFYHAVPFRDLLNRDHKKFDFRSTKANFIVGV